MHRQPDPNDRSRLAEVPLGEKVAFLRRPEAYPEPTRQVETVETHMSWVFLTDAHAYKLKKPVRYPFLDYSTLDRRHHMCGEEVRLNRRLAPWVYLGLVPLMRDDGGRLALGEPGPATTGTIVEWLVQMVRLPAGKLLDQAIRHGTVTEPDAERAAAHLADFYRAADPIAVSAPDYIGAFGKALSENAREMAAAGIPERRFAAVVRALSRFLDERAPLLRTRIEQGHIIEGHGDLRPEHIFLGEPAAIIDCLEFDRALRLLDPLEELAFLSMECDRLGAAKWGELFVDVYHRHVGDDAAEELMCFYRASRACLRSKLAVGHLHDGEIREPRRWLNQADQYLELANRYVARL
jgi:aminoglycoside phosphotransferase family enzyme